MKRNLFVHVNNYFFRENNSIDKDYYRFTVGSLSFYTEFFFKCKEGVMNRKEP